MSRFYRAITLGVLTGLSGIIIILLPYGFSLEENVGLPLLFALRGPEEAPSEVLVVNIDKLSAEKLNLSEDPKEWPRSLHARLINNLSERGASVIAFDLFFNEPRSEEEDNIFAASMSKAENVVLSEYLKLDALTDVNGQTLRNELIETHVMPIPSFAQAAASVACFPLPKVPGNVSQYWTFKTSAGNVPTLPVIVLQMFAMDVYDELIRLVQKYGLYPVDNLPLDKESLLASNNINNVVRLIRNAFESDPAITINILQELQSQNNPNNDPGKIRLLLSLINTYKGPDTKYINFYGPPRTITTLPYHQVLEPEDERTVNSRQFDFSNKVVFVGRSENIPSEKDIDGFHTVFSLSSGVDISGVEIAATAFANLLENKSVQPLNHLSYAGIMLFWGLLASIIIWRLRRPAASVICVVAIGVLYVIFALYQFKEGGMWYPLVVPLLIQTPIAFLGDLMWNRTASNKLIRHFLPSAIVNKIIGGDRLAEVKSTWQTVYGICLVTDIAGFTTASETMNPEIINNFKKEYFRIAFEPLRHHDLFFKKSTGDGIVAAWNEDNWSASKEHPCVAAMKIRDAVELFNRDSHIKFPTRIGLHCGSMSVGIIDTAGQCEYDISGDTVNTTQRIEALNKQIGTQILLSEDVLGHFNGVLTREVGEFLLAGKTNPLVLHELICLSEDSTEQQKNICLFFSEALDAFRSRAWEKASVKLNDLINMFGHDGPSDYYMRLCKQYNHIPPGESWGGEIRLAK